MSKEVMMMGYSHLDHPCFNGEARHQYGRIHLPVAPECNIQCHFCNRKYDCVNESRPGVTSVVLSPWQALVYIKQYLKFNPRISTVGIAGPGDPMANPEETLETIRLIRTYHPELLFCLSTNGLQLLPYIETLKELGVSHVTLTLNAVDPAVGAQIYAWVRDGKVVYRGAEGAALLLERQLAAVAQLKQKGFIVKINTIVIPGINDGHIPEIAEKARKLKADIMNCIPLYPARGSRFEAMEAPSPQTMEYIRSQVEPRMPLMKHCARCRADAAGRIGTKMDPATQVFLREAAALPLYPEQHRPYVAVATMEGLLINRHLGEAEELSIYKVNGDTVELVQIRPTPKPGGGEERWRELSRIIGDCQALLVNGIGQTPRDILKKSGIKVYETEGLIAEAVLALANGKSVRSKASVTRCGFSCKGDGLGCG